MCWMEEIDQAAKKPKNPWRRDTYLHEGIDVDLNTCVILIWKFPKMGDTPKWMVYNI